MVISKNSWHYRLLKFTNFDAPNTLCPYFWKTVWACIFITGVAAFVLMLTWAVLIGFGLTYMAGTGGNPFEVMFGLSFSGYLKAIGISLFIDVAFVLIVFTVCYILLSDLRRDVHELVYDCVLKKIKIAKYDSYDDRRYRKYLEKKNRKPNLLKEMVKAKKSKLCPFLEFQDVEKDEK